VLGPSIDLLGVDSDSDLDREGFLPRGGRRNGYRGRDMNRDKSCDMYDALLEAQPSVGSAINPWVF
jgi:hypothetical protein